MTTKTITLGDIGDAGIIETECPYCGTQGWATVQNMNGMSVVICERGCNKPFVLRVATTIEVSYLKIEE